jgi:hypothetical protein
MSRGNQRDVCVSQGCDFLPVSDQDKVGLASSTLGRRPINGLRHPVTSETTGWYIWCGEYFSDSPDYFQAFCVEHLLDKLPSVADLLGLSPGYRFIVDGSCLDIWFDEKLFEGLICWRSLIASGISSLSFGPAVNVVIVLTSPVLGHGRRDLRRHILHILADHIGNMPVWLVNGCRCSASC